MNLLTFLNGIPAVFWSGIFGSLLTLGGVLIANKSNTTRLRMQLDHDAKQKATERTATMRREVYMKAAEELSKVTQHVASFPAAEPTSNMTDGMQEFFRIASKMQLVAESKTGLHVSQLVSAYGELVVRITPLVRPIHDFKIDISIHDNLYQAASAQVTRVLGELRSLVETAQIDEPRYAALQKSLNSFQAEADHHAQNRSDAWDKYNAELRPFYQKLLAEMRTIGPLQINVLVEIRRDLGLTTDLDEYRKEMEKQWNSMELQLENALNKIMGE